MAGALVPSLSSKMFGRLNEGVGRVSEGLVWLEGGLANGILNDTAVGLFNDG